MITVRTNLHVTPESSTKTVVMEMDAESAFYLSSAMFNIQDGSEELRAFCTLLARHLFENANKAR